MTAQTQLSPLGLATVLLAAFLSIADFFIVNVALPTIDSDLHASTATLELVVAGYGVPYALLLVLGGRLGDLFGRRRLFMLGMASFTVFSLLCGIAPTAVALVAFRAAQGASAALMVPQVLATIQATSVGRQRAKAIGLYGATAGIAAVVGQLAGGALVDANIAGTGWRPIFLVNVPLGIVGLLLAWRMVPATRSLEVPRIDTLGTVTLGIAVLALLVPLTEGRALGWPAWSWLLLALFVPAVAAFALVERRLERTGGHPIVPPSLLGLPGMQRGLAIAVPFFAGFGAFMFVCAISLQQGAHLTPLRAGLALVPMALTFLFASLTTARLTARYGRRVLSAGAVLQAVGLVGLAGTLFAAWPDVNVLRLAPAMAVAGFGQGLVMSPLFGFVLAGVPAARAGVGSGVLATTQQTALALGVASLGSLFLSLASSNSLGMRDAFVVVLAVQTCVAVVVAVAARTLPGPVQQTAVTQQRAPEAALKAA
ncbi:MAG: MFS transporter [Actinobacteria bacterium]|nr:MAG: MFS transporter [Actinomycetota bacterium]